MLFERISAAAKLQSDLKHRRFITNLPHCMLNTESSLKISLCNELMEFLLQIKITVAKSVDAFLNFFAVHQRASSLG